MNTLYFIQADVITNLAVYRKNDLENTQKKGVS